VYECAFAGDAVGDASVLKLAQGALGGHGRDADSEATKLSRLTPGEQFAYLFDFGDN